MKILSMRPIPLGQGNARARFDVELDNGLRLFNIKLAETPSGWRVFAPSAFNDAVATFPRDMAAELVSAARSALGETRRDDREAA